METLVIEDYLCTFYFIKKYVFDSMGINLNGLWSNGGGSTTALFYNGKFLWKHSGRGKTFEICDYNFLAALLLIPK